MKWLPFFIVIFLLLACKTKKKSALSLKTPEPVRKIVLTYNDTVSMPWSSNPDSDTGYFKGYIPEIISRIDDPDTTILYRFLAGLISTKDLIMLNNETLSHSVLVDHKTKIRFDTLRNSKTTIFSKYKFKDPYYQQITIDGIPLKGYKGTGDDIMEGEQIDIDPFSFRHFSFKEEEFYYFRASPFYSVGTSMGNVDWHLLYNLKHKRLFCFESCRFGYKFFGDANGDDRLDYLAFNNSDFCTTVPYTDNVTVRLFSSDGKGGFILQKDKKGMPYFIDGKTGEDFTQDSFNVVRSYWLKPLK